ncbi:hypothetical protein Salat_0664600 [Sesamum alatum]|uniref:Myb/SANT-like domain-containing protein n=1 Tax=Sesamum alatum TaxID=300844 RepID=A0AAE1YS61_9LAMI|nr:hypothetical protein Salat_0664600 [Sesamum alatum]
MTLVDEEGSSKPRGCRMKADKPNTRRTWTQREEEKQFLNMDIRGEPPINSKIHLWKKNYDTLTCMMAKSGFGWDDSWCMITVDTQDIWEEFCKANVDVNVTSTASHKKIGSSRKKRNEKIIVQDDGLTNAANTFCDSANERLGELSKKLFADYNEAEKRSSIYEAIGKVPGIDLNDQILISDRLVENPKRMDLFFSLPEDARLILCLMTISHAWMGFKRWWWSSRNERWLVCIGHGNEFQEHGK